MIPYQPAPGLPVWSNEQQRQTYMHMRLQIVALLIDQDIRKAEGRLRKRYSTTLAKSIDHLNRTSNRIRKTYCSEA